MSRLVWFALGAGAAVWGYTKVRASVRHASPHSVAQRVSGSALELGDSARDFLDRTRAAMAERESELRMVLDQRAARSDRLGLTDSE